MKEILLKPGPALSNRLEIDVIDFPDATESAGRKRCTITVEYGRPDALELKNQGMNLEQAMEHYEKYIYDLVRFRILSEWSPVGGLEESLAIVREHITRYF